MTRTRSTCAALVLFAAVAPAVAAPTEARDAEAIVERYQAALAAAKSLSVDAVRTAKGEGPVGKHRLPPPERARLRITHPSDYKLEVLRGQQPIETVVSDGRREWLWNSKFYSEGPAPRTLAYVSPDIEWAEKAFWPLMVFTQGDLIGHLADLRRRPDETRAGRPVEVLTGAFHAGADAARLKLSFDKATHLPVALQVNDAEVEIVVDFQVRVNEPIARDVFAARPPRTLPRRRQEPEYPRVAVGSRAPDFTLRDLAGRPTKLSQRRGRVVLLDFWAPWCPACLSFAPFINKLQDELKGQGFEVLAISTMATDEQVAAYAQKQPQSVTVLVDPADEEQSVGYARYGISGLPSYVLVDRAGRVRRTWKYYYLGASEARLRAHVAEALHQSR